MMGPVVASRRTSQLPALMFTIIGILSPQLTVARDLQRPLRHQLEVSHSVKSWQASQEVAESPKLESGKPVEREIAGGHSHSYELRLVQNQYLHLIVDQRGIDIVVSLFGPDGKKLDEMDSPNGTVGLEAISIVAAASGLYRLEIRPLEKDALAGRYEVKIEEIREATAKDGIRIAARRAFSDGKNLRSNGATLLKSFRKFKEALSLYRAVSDSGGEAITLTDIGTAYRQLGDKRRAIEYYLQSLPRWRDAGNLGGEAIALNYIGMLYDDLGRKEEALAHYYQALWRFRAVKGRGGEAETLFNIARHEKERGDLVSARSFSEAVIGVSESLRANLGSEAVSTTYFIRVEDFYEFYIDLLMQLEKQEPSAGHAVVALQAREQAHARGLLEMLRDARANIRQGVDPALLEREGTLLLQLNSKSERLLRLRSSESTNKQTDAVAKEITAIENEIERLSNEYQELQAEIRTKSPRYAELTQPRPLGLKEIQQLLDSDTLLLEYALGEERSYLWAVTPTTLQTFELPKRSEVEAAAKRVYKSLAARSRHPPGETSKARRMRIAQADAEYPKAAAALSALVLKNVSSQLRNKRLVIVPDGALQYIPFAALPEPGNISGVRAVLEAPLVINHEIVNLPSASTLAILRQYKTSRSLAAKTLAIVADPVFEKDDPRVRATGTSPETKPKSPAFDGNETARDLERAIADFDGNARFPPLRLAAAHWEAEEISKLVPMRERMQALDFAADRRTAESPELGKYRIVHFATHAFNNSAHPELSGIVLSLVNERGQPQDGFLRLSEIFNLKLPAELVVLSGCQTGLGKNVKGEGLVGMTRGFMYAGAPRIVVSLWSVDDRATSVLMARFYRKMLGRKLSPSAALREAQTEMWRDSGWKPPYFWAGFIFQGEWKEIGAN